MLSVFFSKDRYILRTYPNTLIPYRIDSNAWRSLVVGTLKYTRPPLRTDAVFGLIILTSRHGSLASSVVTNTWCMLHGACSLSVPPQIFEALSL